MKTPPTHGRGCDEQEQRDLLRDRHVELVRSCRIREVRVSGVREGQPGVAGVGTLRHLRQEEWVLQSGVGEVRVEGVTRQLPHTVGVGGAGEERGAAHRSASPR